MSRPERQQNVLELLKGLRGIQPLKQLFWSELNYQRVNQPLSRRGWTESASKALADDPVLFAGGGENNDFHVIYCRLASDKLILGGERPVVSRLLNEHPYTLFVFSNAAQDHWHFLNVKYDDASDKRRLFRRITVGPEERLRTASERISLLSLESFGLAPLTIQQYHDEAFDVEAVTELFYHKFAELFHELRSDIIKSKPGLENEGRNATQDLMNRLLFLYFIQKKGWLDSNPFYLVERFGQTARTTPKATNYYSETLLPLFQALSAPDAPSAKLGKIPFLNGGLFELDLSTEAQLKISNAIFGRLFDELFEHYNFTVREDTPLDQEVAVDPEMLGKVFEELVLEQEQGKDARRGSGSYYTRRVVTHFKARDALRLYLLDESFWPTGTWDKKDLPIDLSGTDSKHGSLESFAHRAARNTTRERVDKYLRIRDPAHLDIPLARHLRDLLKKVKCCDPACGSGAYLVEMLHAIAELWRQLSDILNEKCLPEDKLRQQIISENLYGADIQKTAVKICELRLWLALVVDKELPVGEMPPPLPNLSYRIRVGDSLRSEFAGIVFSPHSLVLNDKTRKRVEQLNQRRLQYARYGLYNYVPAEKQRREPYASLHRAGATLRGLIRILLFKRFESSVFAFKETVRRLLLVHERFLQALEQGFVPAGDEAQAILYEPNQAEEQDLMDALRQVSGRYDIADFDLSRLKAAIEHDVKLLRKMLDCVKPITPEQDAKLQKLKEYLGKKPLKDGKRLIFTQYADTARYLHDNLNPGGKRDDIDVIFSGDKSKARVVGRFAPKANREYKFPAGEKELFTVVATDVLAEGLNLQDCDNIINYDLHWNPVRLIQRFGRIDRIGSDHDVVHGFNFLPETELDRHLDLKDKLHNRIQEIHDTIGEDSEILDRTERLNEDAMYAIYENKHGGQMSLFEDEDDEFLDLNEAEEILRQLRKENPAEYQRIADLRDGIRAAKTSTLKGQFVFCEASYPERESSKGFQQLFLLDANGDVVSKDIPRILGAIKCGSELKSQLLPKDYNAAVMRVKRQFAEEVKHRQAERTHTLSLSHGQNYVLRELRVLFAASEDEDQKAMINVLAKSFRGPITRAVNREIILLRRNGVNGEALHKALARIYDLHNLRDWVDRRSLHSTARPIPKIICSEGLV